MGIPFFSTHEIKRVCGTFDSQFIVISRLSWSRLACCFSLKCSLVIIFGTLVITSLRGAGNYSEQQLEYIKPLEQFFV